MAKSGKKGTSPEKSTALTIERGGERFVLEKSVDRFAVKKRKGAGRGLLSAAANRPDQFPGLKFEESASSNDAEVYRLESASLDQAMTLLRESSPDVVWCSHIYHMPGDEEGLMIPTDKIYVEFKPDSDAEVINKLLQDYGLELMPADDDNPNAFVIKLTSRTTANPIKIANALSESGAVVIAEPDFAMKIQFTAYRPADTLFPQQWHLENRGGFGLTAGADVKAPDAWDITRGSRSIRVCIIDDGVQVNHPDFNAPGKIVAPYDFGQNDPDPSPVASNDDHGTSCAGVAVAEENGQGVVGLAPGCALMPVRSSGMISNESIRSMFDYARLNGADVISCSWGVSNKFFTLSTPMINAIRRAATEGRGGRGCVVLFAAGNEDSPVDGTKNGVRVRAGFAMHPDVIAVSASNSHDRRSHYSNYGKEIWVCAPSSGSGGRGIVTTDRTGAAGYQAGDYTTVNGFGGTSSSTPLVAGLCGLILSVNPDLTSADVKEILRQTAEKIDPAGGNYNAEGHAEWYGWGKVKAHSAVLEAQQRLAPAAIRRVSFERNPALAIPDANPAGASDIINITDSAKVRSAVVEVDISHTYRGDLKVALVAPDSSEILLHDRQGGSRDNLVTSYTAAEIPALASLVGKPAQGNWMLRVYDLASADTGRLNRWALALDLEASARSEWQSDTGMIIPDNDPNGIVSEISVDGSGQLQDIELTVDINHTWRGDLQVELLSPSGASVNIHNMTGGSADNLQQTYTAADTPALQNLVAIGSGIQGIWKLRVADRAQQDVGKLNSWKLRLIT